MRPADLREMTAEELEGQLQKATDEMFRLKFRQTTAQNTNSAAIRKARRDIARLKTIEHERQLGISTAPTGRSRSSEPTDQTTED